MGPDLQLEYPVAGPWTDGQLPSGYIDLVAVTDGQVNIIDFKTDTLPPGPAYVDLCDFHPFLLCLPRKLNIEALLTDMTVFEMKCINDR